MPTRYLKPGIRDSEAIDSLSPLAETLYYRLLVTVDDFGRYDARPTMVKAHCFPIKDMTSAKCAALLDELHSDWSTGKRRVPAARCIDIERVTGGMVRCEELRPDMDWSFVRGDKKRKAQQAEKESA